MMIHYLYVCMYVCMYVFMYVVCMYDGTSELLQELDEHRRLQQTEQCGSGRAEVIVAVEGVFELLCAFIEALAAARYAARLLQLRTVRDFCCRRMENALGKHVIFYYMRKRFSTFIISVSFNDCVQ